jgi:hypothetical protein
MGDFNSDTEIDIAFGGEDWDVQNTVGLYAYSGNGGTNWTSNSTGLWPSNSWGGLQLADADEDGYMELYATDEDWGTRNSSGVKAWEFRNGVWKDSSAYVSTPVTSGQPSNVILTNMTGNYKLDMLVCTYSGVRYFENKGGNPVTWQERSGGLPTSSWYTGAAVEDMNKDGLKDIITVRNDQERMFVQQASGTLWKEYSSGLSVPGYVLGVVAVDLNQDTHNDIIFATCTPSDGNGLRVKLGNSGGATGTSFTWTAANAGLPTSRRYAQIQAVDIDLDGDLDIIGPCASGDEGMKIFLGNGSDKPGTNLGWTEATNTNLPSEGDWYGANTYDINGDGSLDIVGASWGMGIRAWLNNISSDGTPPAAVTDLTAVEATTDSIKLNWTAPADNGTDPSSGHASSYDIRYSTSTINLGNWGGAIQCTGEPVPASPGSTQEFNITGLAPATQYFIVIRTLDEMPNTSPLSNILINSTMGIVDIVPPGMVSDLAVVTATNDTINLTWTAPADNGTDISSGPVIEYDLRYYSGSITDANWGLANKLTPPPVPGMPGTTETFSVQGLDAETTYHFAIKARDERPNWGALSNSPSGITLPDPDIIPPEPVTDLTASEPSVDSIKLTWTAPGDDGSTGTASLYDIRYSKSLIDDASWAAASQCTGLSLPQAAGTEEQYLVTDLEPETTYYFALRSADETPTWSALSNIATNTTLPLPDEISPAVIIDLEAGNPTYTTITLTWTAPGDDGAVEPAELYDIRYAPGPIASENWPGAIKIEEPPLPGTPGEPESYVVTGLEQNTLYYFAMRSADEVPNWSPVSNSPSASTLKFEGESFELVPSIAPERTELSSGESIIIALEVVSWPEQLLVPDVSVKFSTETAGAILSPPSGTTDNKGRMITELTAPEVSVLTELSVMAEVEKEGFRSNSTSITLTVNPPEEEKKFNLRITDDDITFIKPEGGDGTNITIRANITNDGLLDATGFLVLFYVDRAQLGTADNLTGLESLDVLSLTRTWTVTGGAHTVRVEVIPWHLNLESDSTDNIAEVIVTIEGTEVVDVKPTPDPDDDGIDDDKPGGDQNDEPEGGTGGSDVQSFWNSVITAIFAVIAIVIIAAVLFIFKSVKDPEQEEFYSDEEELEE